jgi:hypothetical protein
VIISRSARHNHHCSPFSNAPFILFDPQCNYPASLDAPHAHFLSLSRALRRRRRHPSTPPPRWYDTGT